MKQSKLEIGLYVLFAPSFDDCFLRLFIALVFHLPYFLHVCRICFGYQWLKSMRFIYNLMETSICHGGLFVLFLIWFGIAKEKKYLSRWNVLHGTNLTRSFQFSCLTLWHRNMQIFAVNYIYNNNCSQGCSDIICFHSRVVHFGSAFPKNRKTIFVTHSTQQNLYKSGDLLVSYVCILVVFLWWLLNYGGRLNLIYW